MGEYRYVLSHEAFYWDAAKEPGVAFEVIVQRHDDVGENWEFEIQWEPPRYTAALTLFDEVWKLFAWEPRLFQALAELEDFTVADVVGKLVELGYVDRTERDREAFYEREEREKQ